MSYIALANITLSSSASSVTFSNIPNTYRDLVLILSLPSITANGYPWLRFNSDSGANYNRVTMQGDGSSTGSFAQTGNTELYLPYDFVRNNINGIVQIMDYSATDKHKTVLTRMNDAGLRTSATASRWASTSAITTILVDALSADYPSGSTFALYGIAG